MTAPAERPIRTQYTGELRDDPFFLPGVDDYDDGWTDKTDDEEERDHE